MAGVDPRLGDSAPSVTVVIPLHNGARYVAETLNSVQRQTIADIEVIVVDDGSTDDGLAIVRGHPLNPTLFEQQHLGVAVARNRGLRAARGRWVAFLDQDDLWHPSHLERLIDWLSVNPGERIVFSREIAFSTVEETDRLQTMDALVGGWASILVHADHALDELTARADVRGSSDVQRHDLAELLQGPVSVTTSFIADPELLHLAGGFAPHALAMDDYWLLVNVARLQRIAQLDQPTVFYRVHVRATSRTTKLGIPFLSSAVALRLGGGLIPLEEGLAGGSAGKLHGHLFGELLASADYRDPLLRRAVGHLAGLIWPPYGRRRQRGRARLAARMPWLQQTVRRVRAIVRGSP